MVERRLFDGDCVVVGLCKGGTLSGSAEITNFLIFTPTIKQKHCHFHVLDLAVASRSAAGTCSGGPVGNRSCSCPLLFDFLDK